MPVETFSPAEAVGGEPVSHDTRVPSQACADSRVRGPPGQAGWAERSPLTPAPVLGAGHSRAGPEDEVKCDPCPGDTRRPAQRRSGFL